MHEKIIEKLREKKLAILGFGREGQSTFRFIRKYLPEKFVTILDLHDVRNNPLLKKEKNIKVITGEKYLDFLNDYDLIMKTPGISLKNLKEEQVRQKITSQLELLLEVDRQNIIGITGTKGKSTTTSLLYQVFQDQGVDTYLLGNIGVPVLDQIEKYKKDTILVIEMSSHQLEFIKVSPHIAIVLNLFQDHLDHDGSLEHYYNNKMNIFRYQDSSDIMIYADDNLCLHNLICKEDFKAEPYDIRFDDRPINKHSLRLRENKVYYNDELLYEDGNRKLLGDHNLKNIMFVLSVAKLKGLDLDKAKKTIASFQGLKYRMEWIGTFDEITYYNDTIATIPEATIQAIETLREVDTLIFGGLDRGISYEHFIEYLKECSVKNLICMPTTGYHIGKILMNQCDKNIFFAETLVEAYSISKKVTKKGKICLLSPAAASYEYFKNFEEKGKCFEEIVKGKTTDID